MNSPIEDTRAATLMKTDPAAPQAEFLQCKAQISVPTAGLTLTLASKSLADGKWATEPPNTVSGPSMINFMAQGKSDVAIGTEGTVVYTTPDGATITMFFAVPYIGSNRATITCAGSTSASYDCSVTDVPKDKAVISPVYTVKKK